MIVKVHCHNDVDLFSLRICESALLTEVTLLQLVARPPIVLPSY